MARYYEPEHMEDVEHDTVMILADGKLVEVTADDAEVRKLVELKAGGSRLQLVARFLNEGYLHRRDEDGYKEFPEGTRVDRRRHCRTADADSPVKVPACGGVQGL